MAAYEDGVEFGKFIKAQHDGPDPMYDPRWTFADEARTRSSEDFKEYMRGVTDGCS